MATEVVPGTTFQHVVFRRDGRPARVLHAYLGGDGTPWAGDRPAADPTPRDPLLLRLMALDSAPTVYLGRPCYHGRAGAPPCSAALWTSARYSEPVVASMAMALRRMVAAAPVDRLVLIGYSGGGTLAVLLAPRFKETTDVVTIAANLDIDAWADLHGYLRLAGSVNPAAEPRLPEGIHQQHYVGGRDRVVPKEIVARGPIDPSALIVIPSYDHVCCWEAIWPAVLAGLARGEERDR
jgi:pimeloyl-ACP methyl ester carboxylesterase